MFEDPRSGVRPGRRTSARAGTTGVEALEGASAVPQPESPEFAVESISVGPETTVVAVHGDADLHTAPRLKVELGAQIDRGVAHVVVDLTEATFVDSMTLGVLLGALKRLRPSGGRMSVVCGDPHIRKIFELTLLDQVFKVTGSRDEALSAA